MPHDSPHQNRPGCTEQKTNTTAQASDRAPRISARHHHRGRRTPERYHAVADQDGQRGSILIYENDALCGALGPWADTPEDGLFPPLVNCRWCRQIADNHGITIREGDQP